MFFLILLDYKFVNNSIKEGSIISSEFLIKFLIFFGLMRINFLNSLIYYSGKLF